MTYLDTRDLLTELDELEERETWCTGEGEPDEPSPAHNPLDDDEQERLDALRTLRDEVGVRAMRDGETMIPEDEFEEYAQVLADDIGAINAEAHWPLTCIDWEQAARELSYDYLFVYFAGTNYYVRAS